TVLMRMVDVMLVIPSLPLMILIAAYAGSGLWQIILILSLFAWEIPARLIRTETLSLRTQPYVQAAQAIGCDTPRIIRLHLLPALAPVLLTSFTTQASRAVFVEAGLAFIGIGDPTAKSWGAMLRAATSFNGIWHGPYWLWWVLPTALNISLLVIAFAFAGQGLERWANPALDRHAGQR
ncbi:MAG: ABC transporter permease, partial [Chloroflexi bacterium]|nr:ABC transporter permease [Chloroflexota bacterium]